MNQSARETKTPSKTLSARPPDKASTSSSVAAGWRTLSLRPVEPWGSTARLQAKLEIGAVDDPSEREADRVADQVMRMPEQQAWGGGQGTSPTSRCPECAEEERVQKRPDLDGANESLARGAAGATAAGGVAPQAVHSVLRQTGQPLDPSTRAFLEPRFGRDFSSVRIHADTEAQRSATMIGAQAYTVGRHVVLGRSRYAPHSEPARRLLAHELAHVAQQSGPRPAVIQRRFRPDELMDASGAPRGRNPVATSPDTYFHRGSVGARPGRRAVVIAGIHGNEPSARELGQKVEGELSSGSQTPYFHTVMVPQVNPVPTESRGAGSGATRVADLNREFGTGHTSPSHYAQRVTNIVEEFNPERILSVHAIRSDVLGGIFLDPIHARLPPNRGESPRDVDFRSYPPVGTPEERRRAFTADPRNFEAMRLTQSMIGAVEQPIQPSPDLIRGNRPRRSHPASLYPTPTGTPTAASPYSLIYPLQSSVTGGVTLGVWASGHGRTVVTLEIPGYTAPRSTWEGYLPSVWTFLRQAPVTAPRGGAANAPDATGTSAPQHAPIPPSPQTGGRIQRQEITSVDLRRQPNAERDRFMRRVYDFQVGIWRSRGVSYVGSVPARDLVPLSAGDVLPGRQVSLHRGVANDFLLPLLSEARADLAADQVAAVPAAQQVTSIRVRSGYRSAQEQFSIWETLYARYYRDTRAHRSTLPGGEHGDDAARYMAGYINERVFSPGYSPHQRAMTVDFTYQENGTWATADTDPAKIATWRASWLFKWLLANAMRFGFVQNPDLNEPWHWEFSPLPASLIWILQLMEALLDWMVRFFGLVPAGEASESPPEETHAPQ